MSLHGFFSDLVKEQAKDAQKKLDNLGHALDGEDISQTEFTVKASLNTYLLLMSIAGLILTLSAKMMLKDLIKAAMGVKYDAGSVKLGLVLVAFALLFVVIFAINYRRKTIIVKGSEMIVGKKAYHCSDVTSAKLGVMNRLTLKHAGKTIVSLSLPEYENSEKLAAWLERCNIPVEQDTENRERNETAVRIIALLTGLFLGLGICYLMKKL